MCNWKCDLKNIRLLTDTPLFFLESFALSQHNYAHIHAYVHIYIYSKRNGILKIESPRLALYATGVLQKREGNFIHT